MGIKSKIANYILNSRLKAVQRVIKISNLEEAKSVGILWEIDQKESYDRCLAELNGMGIITSGLCYFPTRKAQIPAGITGFTKKQTWFWLEIPKAESAQNFIQQKFDILIDLTAQSRFPIIFVTALSEAAFKIGSVKSSANYFDWSIEFAEEIQTSQLVEQILYYLKRINKATIE
jgi:hypothetical protein